MSAEQIVTNANVETALKCQKGEGALLNSWTFENNDIPNCYSTAVKKISVEYNNDEKSKTSFIVKINPLSSTNDKDEIKEMFLKEGKFYTKVLPEMNKALTYAEDVDLKVPACYHVNLEEGKEIIFLEDLEKEGFRKIDKTKQFDLPHLVLILNELGRFHSAFNIFRNSKTVQEVMWIFPFLKESIATEVNLSKDSVKEKEKSIKEISSKLLKEIDGYSSCLSSISSLEIFQRIMEQITNYETLFEVICHGDCSENNYLFKYDTKGFPVDIRLLDFHSIRLGSLAFDINAVLYSHAAAFLRNNFLPILLSSYNCSFKNVLNGAEKDDVFTEEQFRTEYKSKNVFGCLTGLLNAPFVFLKEEEMASKGVPEDARDGLVQRMKSSPLLRPRFVALIDEMIETNILNKE